jgi:hypothetical protein
MGRKITQEIYIKECEEKFPNHFDLSNVEYISKRKTPKIKVTCLKKSTSFIIHPSGFKNRGCPICNVDNAKENQRMTKEEFIERSKKIHGNSRFCYSKVNYIDANTKVDLYDNLFGIWFSQTPANHFLHSSVHERNHNFSIKYVKNKEFFLEKVVDIFGIEIFEKYDYENSVYKGMSKDITIKCKNHNTFFTLKAKEHIYNKVGCPTCGKERTIAALTSTKEEFVENANIVHGVGTYIYDNVFYVNNRTKVEITCNAKKHKFEQTPDGHLQGRGCQFCYKPGGPSKGEIEWLDMLGIEIRQLRIYVSDKKYYILDGYDPITNTVYEYNGGYWHGTKYPDDYVNQLSKKTMKQLQKETLEKEESIKAAGYNLVIMREDEWIASKKMNKIKKPL